MTRQSELCLGELQQGGVRACWSSSALVSRLRQTATSNSPQRVAGGDSVSQGLPCAIFSSARVVVLLQASSVRYTPAFSRGDRLCRRKTKTVQQNQTTHEKTRRTSFGSFGGGRSTRVGVVDERARGAGVGGWWDRFDLTKQPRGDAKAEPTEGVKTAVCFVCWWGAEFDCCIHTRSALGGRNRRPPAGLHGTNAALPGIAVCDERGGTKPGRTPGGRQRVFLFVYSMVLQLLRGGKGRVQGGSCLTFECCC